MEAGTVGGGGQTLSFDSSHNHAWSARSFSGVTVMDLAPNATAASWSQTGPPSQHTVQIAECDLSTAGKRLHFGWR